MNDQVTITLTKEQAAKLKQIEAGILDRMNRVDFLAHIAEHQAEYTGVFPSSVWDGMSATLKDLNRGAGDEHSLVSALVKQIKEEVAA